MQKAFLDGDVDATRATLLCRIPDPDLQAECLKFATKGGWCEKFHDHISNGGPLTTRELEKLITTFYTRTLTGAPWKLDDATLLAREGACATCPKNARNMNGGKSSDVCTDIACFDRKQNAQWELTKKAAVSAPSPTGGKLQVMADADAGEVFDSYGDNKLSYDAPFFDLAQRCQADSKGRNYRDLLRDSGVPVVVARDHNGKMRQLVPQKEAREALVAAKVISNSSGSRQSTNPGAAKAAREAALNRKVNEIGLPKIRALAEAAPTSIALLRFIAAELFTESGADTRKMVGRVRGVIGEKASGYDWKETAAEKWIAGATEPELRGFIVELWSGPDFGLSQISETFEHAATLYKLDLKKLAKEIQDGKHTARKPSKHAAQRKVNYAQDLCDGKPIVWPKESNALIVTVAGKHSNILKGNEDTVKGLVPSKVEFGKIKFDSKKRPDWKSFKAVAQ
jgi:hypothetical protein